MTSTANTVPALILNIGLEQGSTGQFNTLGQTVTQIERAGLRIGQIRIVESDTETTVVAQVAPAPIVAGGHLTLDQTFTAIDWLAAVLRQDCIATYLPAERRGLLIGSGAARWGSFDHSYFFGLDGQRLAPLTLLAEAGGHAPVTA
jgi:hypothetical protein